MLNRVLEGQVARGTVMRGWGAGGLLGYTVSISYVKPGEHSVGQLPSALLLAP